MGNVQGGNSLTPELSGIYSAVMSRMKQGGPRLCPCRCPGVRSRRPMGIFSAVFAGMLSVLLSGSAIRAFAAFAENDAVRVRCDEPGIIIRAEGEDFVILAPRQDEHFQAEVLVQPLGDWELVRPTTNPFNMKGRDAQGYEAKLEPEMEVSYTIGTHGQNNPKPAALFGLHLLVSTLNPDVFYDPSYGLKHTSLQSIDDTLSGFLLNETIHTSGPVKGLMPFRKNKAGIQVYLKY